MVIDLQTDVGQNTGPFSTAVKMLGVMLLVLLLLWPFAGRHFVAFAMVSMVFAACLYFAWRVMWHGSVLLVAATPERSRVPLQGLLSIVAWSLPLYYFATPSNTLASIASRSSWPTFAAEESLDSLQWLSRGQTLGP